MEEAPPPIAPELRFLVVEDHGFQRWTVGHQLQALGAKAVFFASDGHEALEILKGEETPIDVIVTDLDMPGMDGIEFLRHVSEAGGPVSIILLSALERALLASVSAMVQSYGVTLLDTIEKPITARKLEAAMRKYVKPLSAVHSAVPLPAFTVDEVDAAFRREEFEPFFHPRIEMFTGELTGAEAVARWRHPQKGIMPRSTFMAALEQAGHLEEFGLAMLRDAARSCASWRAEGVSLPVSVQVPLAALTNVAVPTRFTQLVKSFGLEPRDIILQTADAATSNQLGRVLEILARLRMAGFGLSLDDYGMGYSSMQQLTQIPFTELRIDRSFVRAALSQPAKKIAIESSLEMAAKLRITAVAEGVDTREQALLLHRLGCHVVQGLFVAKPMSAAEFPRWARAHDAQVWMKHFGFREEAGGG
jgi:EAL domain-containing protein (putative c-di-GMP-specific phosphodiesterase class I)/CheY-like chemotaxis protein